MRPSASATSVWWRCTPAAAILGGRIVATPPRSASRRTRTRTRTASPLARSRRIKHMVHLLAHTKTGLSALAVGETDGKVRRTGRGTHENQACETAASAERAARGVLTRAEQAKLTALAGASTSRSLHSPDAQHPPWLFPFACTYASTASTAASSARPTASNWSCARLSALPTAGPSLAWQPPARQLINNPQPPPDPTRRLALPSSLVSTS